MKLALATRGSSLAMTQTQMVMDMLAHQNPELELEPVVIKTEGDEDLETPIADLGGKAVFASALERALSEGRVDMAVHSAKDLSANLPEGLTLGAVSERGDPRDLLVGVEKLEDLPDGARVGTGAMRRQVQLRALRKDLEPRDIRGNVQTRLGRLGEYDAILLAAAGVKRLGLNPKPSLMLTTSQMTPQVGQGFLAVEYDEARTEIGEILATIDNPSAHRLLEAERGFLKELGGDCTLPAGAYATYVDDTKTEIQLQAMLANEAGTPKRAEVRSKVGMGIESPEALGRQAAKILLDSTQ